MNCQGSRVSIMEEFGTHFLAMPDDIQINDDTDKQEVSEQSEVPKTTVNVKTAKQCDTVSNVRSDFSRYNRHKCKYCGTNFNDESDLQRHISNLCDGNTRTYSRFITHNVTMSMYSCTLCGNKFEKVTELKQHISKKHHAELIKNASYRIYQESIQMNEETIKQEVSEQNEVLKKTVSVKTTFSRHYRHKCTHCGLKFKNESYLERHYSEVHNQMNCDTMKQGEPEENEALNYHTCKYCKKVFSQKSNLTVHVKKHHPHKVKEFLIETKIYQYQFHKKCAVNSCSTMAKVNRGLYRFPENVKLKKKWLESCHLNLSPDDCKIVCPGFVFN